jgi:hypothetical protein
MDIPVRVAAELDEPGLEELLDVQFGVAVFNGGLGIHSAAASRANRNSRNFRVLSSIRFWESR